MRQQGKGGPMGNATENAKDIDFNRVIAEERRYFNAPPKAGGVAKDEPHESGGPAQEPIDEPDCALCLSGGGIRSATFSLGVLQGLAQRGLLSGFHYLSTVSGGGYIGSWLSRWVNEENGKVSAVEAMLAGNPSSGRTTEPVQVRNLRAYSNYLSPVWGLSTDFFTLISIFLRNLALNWLVLLPVLGMVVLLPRIYVGAAWQLAPTQAAGHALLLLAAALLVVAIAYVVADLPSAKAPPEDPPDLFAILCFAPVLIAAMLLGLLSVWPDSVLSRYDLAWYAGTGAAIHAAGCVAGAIWRILRGSGAVPKRERNQPGIGGAAWEMLLILGGGAAGGAILYGAVQWLPEKFSWLKEPEPHALLVVPALIFCFWLATTVYVALEKYLSSEGEREWWSRSGGWWLRAAFGWVIGFGVVVYLPTWVLEIPGASAGSLALGGGVWGAVIGIIGYWSRNGTKFVSKARGVAAAMGLRLLDLAAFAFILALLLLGAMTVDLGLHYWRDPAAALHAAAQRRMPTTVRDMDAAVRATEARLKAVEAMARGIASAPSSAPDETVARLRREAMEVGRSTAAFARVASAFQGDGAGTAAAAETAARVSEQLSKTIETTRKADGDAARTLAESQRHVVEAIAVLAAAVADRRPAHPGYAYRDRLSTSPLDDSIMLLILLLFLGASASLFVGINTFSLHGMYGNRLVRAYLGAVRQERRPHWFTGFDFNDNVSMHDLQYGNLERRERRLFHVVNLALNLVGASGDRLEWQQRKAAAFSVTPLHAGSAAIAYQDSRTYSGDDGISLGRAMTISGAAASPNMGYHSSPAVSFVMTFFNARLGWWLPNPGEDGRKAWRLTEPRSSLLPLLWEALGATNRKRAYVYLSDGGHFENLGLYEMAKRRCLRILVVDASADPKRGYGDLESAVRKIRIDLGVSIEFEPDAFREPRRLVVGRIQYGDRTGTLVYLKPVVCGDEPLDVLRYTEESRRREPESPFPHQSTADQFFNESQFESYRMLGLHSIATVFGKAGDPPRWPTCDDPPAAPASSAASALAAGDVADSRENAIAGESAAGIAGAMQSLGQGALIASAITIGGVVGVTGTVALRDSTVSLKPGTTIAISEESLKALNDVGVRLEPSMLKVEWPRDAGPNQENLLKVQLELSGALSELRKFLGTHVRQSEVIERTLLSIERVEKQIANDRIVAAGSIDLTGLNQAINGLNKSIEEFPAAAGKAEDGKDLTLGTRILRVQEALRRIEERVAVIPPRQNVRGTE